MPTTKHGQTNGRGLSGCRRAKCQARSSFLIWWSVTPDDGSFRKRSNTLRTKALRNPPPTRTSNTHNSSASSVAASAVLPTRDARYVAGVSTVATFAAAAAQFCEWVETPLNSAAQDLACARLLASRLYTAALELDDFTDAAANVSPAFRDATNASRRAVFARFATLPINMYAVVDPLVVPGEGAGVGDVADDLADTYFDVSHGLRLYRAGATAEAAWHWSFSFHCHWGEHVAKALMALHAAAARG